MLGPRFKEGNDLVHSASIEIALPDDDPAAMDIMCQVLHLQSEATPVNLSPDEIVTLARLTDKYECMRALNHSACFWIGKHAATTDDVVRCKLLTAAFFFKTAELFGSIGKATAMKSTTKPVCPVDDCSGPLVQIFGKSRERCE